MYMTRSCRVYATPDYLENVMKIIVFLSELQKAFCIINEQLPWPIRQVTP